MPDNRDALNELELDVEAQGGARMPDKHLPIAGLISYFSGKAAGGDDQKVATQGCSQDTLFVVPYEHQPTNSNLVEERMVTLCACCDLMPLMARFSGPPT